MSIICYFLFTLWYSCSESKPIFLILYLRNYCFIHVHWYRFHNILLI